LPKLDEASLRREPFSEGYAVELADGQRWVLPAVKMRFFPVKDDDGTFVLGAKPWFADQFEEELDMLFEVQHATFGQVWQARLRIASHLLQCNYNVTDRDVGHLLAYVPGDPTSEARWSKIREAILGRDPDAPDEDDADPKAPVTPSGSDSPSGVTESTAS